MKPIIKYLFIALLVILTLTFSLIFVPSVTKLLTQKAVNSYLNVNADVTYARVGYSGFDASGTLDNNDTFHLLIKPTSFNSAFARLHYEGNLHTFSALTGTELPYITTELNATFHTERRLVKIEAALLKGALNGFINLEKATYGYELRDLNISSYRLQQREPIPLYVTGLLSAKGDGRIEAPYMFRFNIESRALQLEENLTALVSPELQHPLALELAFKGDVDVHAFRGDLRVKSALLDIRSHSLDYDFDRNRFALKLALQNHDQKTVPLKSVTLDLNGTRTEDDINTTLAFQADGYRFDSRDLHYDLASNTLKMDYTLTSLQREPFNLQGDHALFGDVDYTDKVLKLSLTSKSLNGPVILTFQDKKIEIISNNINLESLQETANRPVIVEGSVALRAQADLAAETPLWKASLKSDNLALPLRYRKDIALENNLHLTLSAENDAKGDVRLRPTLKSNTGTINESALHYVASSQRVFFNINVKKLKTPHYNASSLNLRGSFDAKTNRLGKTELTTPHEKVVINALRYAKNDIRSNIDFTIDRLDRFAKLNKTYALSATSHLHYTPQKSTLKLISEQLGSLSMVRSKEQLTVSGKELPVEELLRLSDQPPLMKGDLAYDLHYGRSAIKAKVTSDKLTLLGEHNSTVRPFPLDARTSLTYKDQQYRGQASIKTANEALTFTGLAADLATKEVKSRYALDIKALDKSTFILPEEFKGTLHAHGGFEQNREQLFTLDLLTFQLPKKWHRKLDKDAATYLDTNVSFHAYRQKGQLHLDGTLSNRLLRLALYDTLFDTESGTFALNSALKTALWLKDTDIKASGKYKEGYLFIANANIDTKQETIDIDDLRYAPDEQNLSAGYKLTLKAYPNAPYRGTAEVDGHIRTRPELYATLKSSTLDGNLTAYFTDKKLKIEAENVAIAKLIAFSAQDLPITQGRLNANVSIVSGSPFLDGNLSTLHGISDINISDMILEGVHLDASLKTLRESQDLSLFQGSFSELPIVRTLKEIPTDLTGPDLNSTHFKAMRFLTDIDKGRLRCKDCALSTDKNLIAMRGNINLNSRRFDNFYVGLLHPSNCAYFVEKIEGDLDNPQVQLARTGFNIISGAAISLIGNVGSVVDLGAGIIKKTGTVVGDVAAYAPVVGETTKKTLTKVTDTPKEISKKVTECTPFYNGAIKHPMVH
ncbi:hypothetical protein [Sulfurimonas sp. HSL3-7]|uniref:hypothetical protein n=1 Tax=Sulfonitrofixus jiaomeiensis TaxID=3131938 RepID=UPI0031F76B09